MNEMKPNDKKVFEHLEKSDVALIMTFDTETEELIIISKGGLSKHTIFAMLTLAALEVEKSIQMEKINEN